MNPQYGYTDNQAWRNRQVEQERKSMAQATDPDEKMKLLGGAAAGMVAGGALGLLSKGRSNQRYARSLRENAPDFATHVGREAPDELLKHMPTHGEVPSHLRDPGRFETVEPRSNKMSHLDQAIDTAVSSERVHALGIGGAAAGAGVASLGLKGNEEREKHRTRMNELRSMSTPEIEQERMRMQKAAQHLFSFFEK